MIRFFLDGILESIKLLFKLVIVLFEVFLIKILVLIIGFWLFLLIILLLMDKDWVVIIGENKNRIVVINLRIESSFIFLFIIKEFKD